MKGETLPSGWKLEALGKLSSAIQYGYTAKAQPGPVGPRLLRITDIQNDAVRWDEVPFCKIKKEEKQKYLLAPNDILFARTGATVGKSYLIRDQVPDSVFASYLIRVRLTGEVTPKYVAYFFKSTDYWRQITESQAGIGQPNVNGTKLAQIEIPVAPANQQQRIVAEIEKQFSRLDEAVANLKRVKLNLNRYKASVLKAAVEGKLTEDWREQHPNVEPVSELFERILAERRAKWKGKGKYKEPIEPDFSELPRLPEGWAWTQMSTACEKIQDGTHFSPKEQAATGRFKYITAKNIKPWGLDLSELTYVPERVHREIYSRCNPTKGDVLLIKDGVTTGIATVNPLDEEFSLLSSVALLKPIRTVLDSHYLKNWLNSPAGYKATTGKMTGTAIKRIILEKIKETPIPLPPLTEQQPIVAEVERSLSVIEELETAVEANLTRAERLRQSILQQAFSGQLVQEDPNAGPVSVLLEPVRVESVLGESTNTPDQREPSMKEVEETMTNLIEALKNDTNWISAQEVFRLCGVGDGTETDAIERIYQELRDYIDSARIVVDRREEEDWLRLSEHRGA
jgi:type I restriction enzyme, S subunit